MVVNIHNLIAAVSPDVYCDSAVKSEVKEIVKEKGYRAAADKAKLKDSDYIDIMDVRFTKGAFSLPGLKNPVEQHTLVYDAALQNLEPVYFWLLDFINNEYGESDKLIDNFISSPTSGYFAEMAGRATRMQEEAMKMLGAANQVIKSILNIIYDLKEFKLRLETYDDYKEGKVDEKKSAFLSLKQIWMDTVDIKRGTSSLKGLAQQFDYVTLIDAFMYAENLEAVSKVDLNERVKRILYQRFGEFIRWLEESDKELRKRYEIEKAYLRSQYNTVQLYSRWIKPYLESAGKLEQRAQGLADVVSSFNTAVFELALLGKGKYDPLGDIAQGDLPKVYKDIKMRKYSPIVVVELRFRSIPERGDQRGGYSFRGRVEAKFTSYALNEDELKILKQELEKDDLGDLIALVGGTTKESLGHLKEDIEEFLGEKKEKKKEKKEEGENINPFSALLSLFYKKEEKKEKADLSKGISPDSSDEKVIRSQAILEARWKCRKVYDTYKKEHGMSAFPPVM